MPIQQSEKEVIAKDNASKQYESTGFYFYDGLLGVKQEGKWGFINDDGEIVIPFQFLDRPIFENGYARAYISKNKCGLINLKGEVVIPFEYNNVKKFDDEGYAQYAKGIYWGTIDKRGVKHILPSMKFQQIGQFVNGIAPAKIETKWGLIDTEGNKTTPFQYYEIEGTEFNLYSVRLKPKQYGFLKPNGELLFPDWFDWVGKLDKNGLAIFMQGNKYGILHVSGNFYKPEFDNIYWNETDNCFDAILNGESEKFSALELIRNFFENENSINMQFLEDIVNWILPGIQLFYRDTNYPIDVERTYIKGEIIHAGAFIDVTPKAQKPISRLRFIVASSHAAKFFEVDEMKLQNPNVELWKLTTFHYNSYFKIMDVYKVGENYQVFLLHIPYKSIPLFIKDTNFIFKMGGTSEENLIDIARKSYDKKSKMEPLLTLESQEWIHRTYHPIGTNSSGQILPLDFDYNQHEELIQLGNIVRKLSEDLDEINRPL